MNNQAQYNLAGFDDELERIKILLQNMESGEADYRFLNYFAPGGFAKSYLMERIVGKYSLNLPVCLVRVEEYEIVEPFDRAGLLHQILDDYSAWLCVELPEEDQIENDPLKLANKIIQMMDDARNDQKTSLLLIDDYDHLPLAESRWLEHNLLSPLAALQSVGFVLTSEYELSFNDDFDFRLRLEIREITTMQAEDIAESFLEYQSLAREFYNLSSGIVALVIALRDLARELGINAENYSQRQHEFKQKYFDEYFKGRILKTFDDHTQEILNIVVVLRRFDIRLLNTILREVLPESSWRYDDKDFFELIDSLGSNVKWKKGEYGYVINSALRKVLQEYVRFTNPETFKKVNSLAVQAFRDMLHEGYREHFLIELIYHSIVLYRINHNFGDDQKVSEKISDELVEYLNDESASQMFEDDLDSLRNALKSDQEIGGYINQAAAEAITNYLKARLDENKFLFRKTQERMS